MRARTAYRRLVPHGGNDGVEPTVTAVRRLWNVIFGLLATAATIYIVIAIIKLGLEAAGLYTSHLELIASHSSEQQSQRCCIRAWHNWSVNLAIPVRDSLPLKPVPPGA